MAQRSDFEIGREHYLRKEYEQAVKCFMHGAAQGSCACLGWLGQCYEYGLGVGKDHERAKDCYHAGYWHQSLSERKDSFGHWLEERLKALDSIPLPESEMTNARKALCTKAFDEKERSTTSVETHMQEGDISPTVLI